MDFSQNQYLQKALMQQAASAFGGAPIKGSLDIPDIPNSSEIPNSSFRSEPTPPVSAPAQAPAPTPASAPSIPQPKFDIPSQRPAEALQAPSLGDKVASAQKFASADEAREYLRTKCQGMSQGDMIREGYRLGLWDAFGRGRGIFEGEQLKTPAMYQALATMPSDKNKIKKFHYDGLNEARAISFAEALFPGNYEKQLAYIRQANYKTYEGMVNRDAKWAQISQGALRAGYYGMSVDSLIENREAQQEIKQGQLANQTANTQSLIDTRKANVANQTRNIDSLAQHRTNQEKINQERLDFNRFKLDFNATKEMRKELNNLLKEEKLDESLAVQLKPAIERAQRLQALIKDAGWYSTGATGKFLGALPMFSESDAAQIQKGIDAIKGSDIALSALRALKAFSANGASGLGAASDRDMKLLGESIENLNPESGRESLLYGLSKVLEHYATLQAGIDSRRARRKALSEEIENTYSKYNFNAPDNTGNAGYAGNAGNAGNAGSYTLQDIGGMSEDQQRSFISNLSKEDRFRLWNAINSGGYNAN